MTSIKRKTAAPPARGEKIAYAILGIARDATAAEIRTAYLSLARQIHPDVHQNGAAAFAELNEAYSRLKTEDARAAYEAYLNSTRRPCLECDGQGTKYSFKKRKKELCEACGGNGVL